MRALEVTMAVFGVVLLIEGALDIALPVQRAAGMGLDECASQARLPMVVLGATWIAAGGWILAGARDPVRHLDRVKLALTLPLALLLGLTAAVLRGDVAFAKVAVDLGFDALFIVLFAVLFPRRRRDEAPSRHG